MKAVNLIPPDQRRGAGGVAGRAGGAVYVLLGGLFLLTVMSVVYAVSASQVSDRQSSLARVSAQADLAQGQAAALQPYVSFAAIRQSREQAIASLAANRFDWATAMDQIARALPHDVTLSTMTGAPAPSPVAGSVTPGARVASGPSIALSGCAATHSEVATVLVDLERIVGVASVSLATSQKAGAAAAAGAGACSGASFTATLLYRTAGGAGARGVVPATSGVTAPGTAPTNNGVAAPPSVPAAGGVVAPSPTPTTSGVPAPAPTPSVRGAVAPSTTPTTSGATAQTDTSSTAGSPR